MINYFPYFIDYCDYILAETLYKYCLTLFLGNYCIQ